MCGKKGLTKKALLDHQWIILRDKADELTTLRFGLFFYLCVLTCVLFSSTRIPVIPQRSINLEHHFQKHPFTRHSKTVATASARSIEGCPYRYQPSGRILYLLV